MRNNSAQFVQFKQFQKENHSYKNPFLAVAKRQASLKITRKGNAVVDNGTEVCSTKLEVDLLKDALLDL